MTDDLSDLIRSLADIMREETKRLLATGRPAELAELASAKQRLVAHLETRSAQLARSDPNWINQLDERERGVLLEAVSALRDASAPNAAALERHIQLSLDMMAALTAEAKRASGKQHSTYGAAGGLNRADAASPVSINLHL